MERSGCDVGTDNCCRLWRKRQFRPIRKRPSTRQQRVNSIAFFRSIKQPTMANFKAKLKPPDQLKRVLYLLVFFCAVRNGQWQSDPRSQGNSKTFPNAPHLQWLISHFFIFLKIVLVTPLVLWIIHDSLIPISGYKCLNQVDSVPIFNIQRYSNAKILMYSFSLEPDVRVTIVYGPSGARYWYIIHPARSTLLVWQNTDHKNQ